MTAQQNNKAIIRKNALGKRISSNKTFLKSFSNKICKEILLLNEFKKAKNVLCYMPIHNEVDISPIIQGNLKKIALPRTYKNKLQAFKIDSFKDLENTKYGIPEPKTICKKVPKNKIEIALIPGIAFSHKGMRIGFGKGYYDRYLKNFRGLKIGLAYDFQMHQNIPAEKHDVKMDLIITNKKIYHS